MSVQHAHFIARGQNVGEHQQFLITDTFWSKVGGVVGKGHAHKLSLRSINGVAEDPATASRALATAILSAVPAGATDRHAGNQDSVADRKNPYRRANFNDRADGFMPDDSSDGHRRDVALEDMQISSTDSGGVNANDGIGIGKDLGLGHLQPSLRTGPLVDECFHEYPLCAH